VRGVKGRVVSQTLPRRIEFLGADGRRQAYAHPADQLVRCQAGPKPADEGRPPQLEKPWLETTSSQGFFAASMGTAWGVKTSVKTHPDQAGEFGVAVSCSTEDRQIPRWGALRGPRVAWGS